MEEMIVVSEDIPSLHTCEKMRSSLPKILPYQQQITQPCYHWSILQLLQEDKVGSISKTMFKARYKGSLKDL